MPRIENINREFNDVLSVSQGGGKIREIWLYELCLRFNYCPETASLSVQLVDLYMYKKRKFLKKDLQSLVCVCMCLSSKLFEVNYDDYERYSQHSDLDVRYALKLEKDVLNILDGNILIPTVYSYWSRTRGNMTLIQTKKLFTDVYLRDDIYNNSLDVPYII